MRPEYKRVKILAPHCPKCGERLSGNNSFVLPYECSCGEWQVVLGSYSSEFEIIKKK